MTARADDAEAFDRYCEDRCGDDDDSLDHSFACPCGDPVGVITDGLCRACWDEIDRPDESDFVVEAAEE